MIDSHHCPVMFPYGKPMSVDPVTAIIEPIMFLEQSLAQ